MRIPQPEKQPGSEQTIGDEPRSFGAADAAPQAMTGVRGDRIGRSLRAVEGNGVELQVLHPERGFEASPENRCLLFELGGKVGVAAQPGQAGNPNLGVVDVALDLGQGDRRSSHDTGPVPNGVGGVLPALVVEAAIGPPAVFDEPIAVRVTPLVDPAQGRHDVRPETVDEIPVSGPVEGRSEQDQPERRRIDRAVVRGKRSSPARTISPVRSSCRILPGSASRQSSSAVACRAARRSACRWRAAGGTRAVAVRSGWRRARTAWRTMERRRQRSARRAPGRRSSAGAGRQRLA